jgi:hypothetical protein
MRDDRTLAYSLSREADTWRWSVYGEDGVTVADGVGRSLEAAQSAVNRLVFAGEASRAA